MDLQRWIDAVRQVPAGPDLAESHIRDAAWVPAASAEGRGPRWRRSTSPRSPARSSRSSSAPAGGCSTLLNIHAEMAHSRVVRASYAGMQQAIAEHGTFDAPTREAIALTVGAVDGCDYCQSAHTLGGKAAGLDADAMLAIRAGRPSGDDKLDALLAVVRESAGAVGEVQDATWKQAQRAGWSDEQLAEAFAHLAVNLFTNYFNLRGHRARRARRPRPARVRNRPRPTRVSGS